MRAIAAGLLTAGLLFGTVACADEPEPSSETPQACLDALDSADRIMTLAAEGFGYASDALNAAANFDTYGVQVATAGLDSVGERVGTEGDRYEELSTECRGEGTNA